MSLFDRVTYAMAMAPWNHEPLRTLSDEDDILNAAIAATRQARQAKARPWRPASIDEALGVPSIFGAVTLISNVAGSLLMQGFYNEAPAANADRPRLIVKPNPYTTTREFFRATAYSLATRGEAWWYVGNRDADGMAMSLVPVHPPEVVVQDVGDPFQPAIYWRGKKMANDDMIQMVLSREPPSLRGRGPLQVCGAAISVAVEAQEWAANFFADGGHPSVELHSEVELTAGDAQALREQWVNTPANMPQVTSGPMSTKELATNVPAAQMLDARNWSAGDTARFFNMPGALVEYAMQGSSLTYVNRADLWGEFLERCLYPNYLEPMEQTISDLLTRLWTARFNTRALQRADAKTRYEVHQIAINTGIYGPEQAQAEEGYAAGDIENAPVPAAPPQAFPITVPVGPPLTLANFRCPACHRKLAETAGPGTSITCRCGTLAVA